MAVPYNIHIIQTITFTLRVTSAGGSVARFDYTLNLVCGSTTSGLTLIQDPTFATTMAHTFYLIPGTTTQDLSFPVWTTNLGCAIFNYRLDTDAIAPLVAPTGVITKAGCPDPCNSLTFTTTATGTVSFYIFVTATGSLNTAYSTLATVTIACDTSSGVIQATPASGNS